MSLTTLGVLTGETSGSSEFSFPVGCCPTANCTRVPVVATSATLRRRFLSFTGAPTTGLLSVPSSPVAGFAVDRFAVFGLTRRAGALAFAFTLGFLFT